MIQTTLKIQNCYKQSDSMHTKIDMNSDYSFVIYKIYFIIAKRPGHVPPAPRKRLSLLIILRCILGKKVQCTFTITEAQHLYYYWYGTYPTLCTHCHCNDLLNIYCIPVDHTHLAHTHASQSQKICGLNPTGCLYTAAATRPRRLGRFDGKEAMHESGRNSGKSLEKGD